MEHSMLLKGNLLFTCADTKTAYQNLSVVEQMHFAVYLIEREKSKLGLVGSTGDVNCHPSVAVVVFVCRSRPGATQCNVRNASMRRYMTSSLFGNYAQLA